MEDLQSLMSCLDEISDMIGDGMYLSMADKLKRIHNKLNGDRPFHEDSFYYSDEEEDLDNDDDDDSDYEAPDLERTRRIEHIRGELLEYVRCMHSAWKNVEYWTTVVESISPIKRMSAARKADAIWHFCKKFRDPATLVLPTPAHATITPVGVVTWSWKCLRKHGLRALVSEVGTEEEKEIVKDRGDICEDEISIATMRRINAFEQTIYDDFKESENKKLLYRRDRSIETVRAHEERMSQYERYAQEEEDKLREHGATVYGRDYWNQETHNFFVNDDGKIVDDGDGIRGTFQRR
jgi:hypothetical protein